MSLGLVGTIQDQVKNVFKGKHIDNWIFKLHRQYTFMFILIGDIVIFSQNYLSNAINCNVDNGKEFVDDYCFIHGAAHISDDLQAKHGTSCSSDLDDSDERISDYYLWLPLVLSSCAFITMLPWIVWKYIFERGTMEKLVADCKADKDKEENAEENGVKFYKAVMMNSWQAAYYNLGFAFCEVLNIVAIVGNVFIINTTLGGKFFPYGTDQMSYSAGPPPIDPAAPDANAEKAINPLCHLFPTDVSCDVYSGAINAEVDIGNKYCLLNNNVFNQYFFLILWWWWLILAIVSFFGFTYRIVQLCVGGFGRKRLNFILDKRGISQQKIGMLEKLKLDTMQVSLFTKLVLNLKGSQVNSLIEDISQKRNEEEKENSELKVMMEKEK